MRASTAALGTQPHGPVDGGRLCSNSSLPCGHSPRNVKSASLGTSPPPSSSGMTLQVKIHPSKIASVNATRALRESRHRSDSPSVREQPSRRDRDRRRDLRRVSLPRGPLTLVTHAATLSPVGSVRREDVWLSRSAPWMGGRSPCRRRFGSTDADRCSTRSRLAVNAATDTSCLFKTVHRSFTHAIAGPARPFSRSKPSSTRSGSPSSASRSRACGSYRVDAELIHPA